MTRPMSSPLPMSASVRPKSTGALAAGRRVVGVGRVAFAVRHVVALGAVFVPGAAARAAVEPRVAAEYVCDPHCGQYDQQQGQNEGSAGHHQPSLNAAGEPQGSYGASEGWRSMGRGRERSRSAERCPLACRARGRSRSRGHATDDDPGARAGDQGVRNGAQPACRARARITIVGGGRAHGCPRPRPRRHPYGLVDCSRNTSRSSPPGSPFRIKRL